MTTKNNSISFFEQRYKENKDPWRFATNEYELQRYEHICEALGQKHYSLIFEPGCSIGVLTEKLSALATAVEAIDISPTAVSLAQKRCTQLKNVSISCHSITDYTVNNKTDLFILSEIGYYFAAEEWKNIVTDYFNNCTPSTRILAAHWLGTSKDHLLSGDDVHFIIQSIDGLHTEYSARNNQFRLDIWVKQ